VEEENPDDEENVEEENPDDEENVVEEENPDEENLEEKNSDSESSDIGEIDPELVKFSVPLVRAEPGSLTVSGKIPAAKDGKKKKISAYDRRKMKKQKQKQETGGTSELDTEPSTETTEIPQPADKPKQEQNPPKPKPVQYKKGQKAKLKKIKEKYAWQDEEDRKLNMELLGHGEKQPKKGKRGQITTEVQNLQAKSEHKKKKYAKKTIYTRKRGRRN